MEKEKKAEKVGLRREELQCQTMGECVGWIRENWWMPRFCDVGYGLGSRIVHALSLMRKVPEHPHPHPHDQPGWTRLSPCILSTRTVLFATNHL